MSEQKQTAYERSVQIAMEQMNQPTPKPKPGITEQHKQAFRTAFERFKELWPPDTSMEYWIYASRRVALCQHENKDNPLCTELLTAIYKYLEDTSKEQHNERNTNTFNATVDGG